MQMAPFEFQAQAGLVSALVTLLLATLLIRFAAGIVLDRSAWVASFLTALVGTLAATFVWSLVPGTLGVVLAILVWAAAAALFFRTRWVKGALIGVVAWILWALVTWLAARLL